MIHKVFLESALLGKWFTDKFGESESVELVKSIYQYFKTFSMDYMVKYMMSTQQKKVN